VDAGEDLDELAVQVGNLGMRLAFGRQLGREQFELRPVHHDAAMRQGAGVKQVHFDPAVFRGATDLPDEIVSRLDVEDFPFTLF